MIELCAPALVQRAWRDSDFSDQSVAADVLLRQEPDEEEDEEEEDDDKDDNADDEEENDGYSACSYSGGEG